MAPKTLVVVIVWTVLSAWAGPAIADQYLPGEFLGLDLSKAVLSPKPLGPPAGFTPGSPDQSSERAQAGNESKAAPKIALRRTVAAHLGAGRLVAAVPKTLIRRHGDPFDAQAFDTRIQVWPCRSGGICDWKRPGN